MQSSVVPKEQVREYMQQRAKSSAPPESPERVRELLGWAMLKDEREASKR